MRTEKEIIKEVFKIYQDEKYRLQFNSAEKMTDDMIKIALQYQKEEYMEALNKSLPISFH